MPHILPSRTRQVIGLVFETAAVGFVLFGIWGKMPDSWRMLWMFLASRLAIDYLRNEFSSNGSWNKKVEISHVETLPEVETEPRLRELNELRAKSLITPAEYERRRNEILDPF